MSVLFIILGIILLLGGIACLATPLLTTFGVMYFYMVLMFVTGIVFLVESIMHKRIVDMIFAILSLILGGFMLFSPSMSFVTETIMLYIMAGWLLVRGIIALVNAIRMRKALGGGIFALALIVSILVILSGIYSFIHPIWFAGFLGILTSCYFIVEGIDMIMVGCLGRRLESAE